MFGYRDWKCPKCGAVSPDVSTLVDDQWCPFCGTQMDKVWTAPTTIYRGTGWTERFFK